MEHTIDQNSFQAWITIEGDKSFMPTRKIDAAGVRHGAPPVRVYVFSNVLYPESNRINPAPRDLLIFLNKAASVGFYDGHKNKIVYHRSPNPDYGEEVMCCPNRYVFDAGKVSIPKDFIEDLKRGYDWNYPIEKGKSRCMTTGYMVVKYMEHIYPDREIVLVNFGYEVKKSTYRCPWHNWRFEDKELQKYRHLFTEESKK